MPKISVIIPVYNVEKYLKICLDSVINQTFSDVEIICVNDGSTDNSAKILEEYAKKDKRIVIVNKKNGGLSSARNVGMKAASGEFISFIDSDDWVNDDFLEKLYKNITTLNTDISICAVNLFNEKEQKIQNDSEYFSLEKFDSSFDGKAFSYKDTKDFIMEVPVMAWNKLYRKSFLDKCGAKFPEGLIFEDGPFFFSIFFKTDKVSIVRDLLYFYRINRNGSILKKNNAKFIEIIDIINLMYNEFIQIPEFNQVKYEFFHKKADDLSYRYEFLPYFLKKKFSKKFNKNSVLLDENIFDYELIRKKYQYTYQNIMYIKYNSRILYWFYRKFIIRLMYKIMQILYTEQDIYYFKFWSLKFRLKKRPNICDVWYENDRIYVVLLKRIKFDFKFEYSKLEQK